MQGDRFAVQREMDGALNTLLLPGIRMRLNLHRQIRSNCTLAHMGDIALPRRQSCSRRGAQRVDGLVRHRTVKSVCELYKTQLTPQEQT
jgi:hypothetical protein